MKTTIRIQSKSKEDIELFFDLTGKGVASKGSDTEAFYMKGVYTSIFELDFRGLQKIVTNKKNKKLKNVTKRNKPLKQDIKKNVSLSALVGLYYSTGMSMQKIAEKMNKEGHKNSRGNEINKQQVFRLLKKYQAEETKLLKKK